MLRASARLITGVFRLVTLRVIPLMLIGGILWSGYQVAEAVVRQLDERNEYESRRPMFVGTATTIAQLMPSATPPASATPTVTITASPTTPPPTATATVTPSDIPPSATPTANTVAQASTIQPPISQQAVFATNTPRPVMFSTNTPVGFSPTDEPQPEPTNTATHTATVTATATATQTATVTATASVTQTATATVTPSPTAEPTDTSTPAADPTPEIGELSPLPTPLLPRSVEPGTVINGIEVPEAVPLVPRDYNLVNVILLGEDAELYGDGYSLTDTMIVVSVNRDTGTVNMLSFPRDLYVYIPTTNGLMGRLNITYGLGEAIGWTGGGFGLLRQTFFYNFGINLHYYAKVDFSGFSEIVDLLGGVDIAVDCAYEDYRIIGAELPDGARRSTDDGLYVVDVGYYEMSGAQALWYARTRRTSSDFDRGRRQQQLLRAMWRKARDVINLTNVTNFWSQTNDVLETDMAFNDVLGLVPLMLNLDFNRIESYVFIRTYHTTPITVDGANVQAINPVEVRQLMEDFYRPPSETQLSQLDATVHVYNGTSNDFWDRVAAERLQWEGFFGVASGQYETDDITQTIIIDNTGQQKGSSLNELVRLLNVRPENVRIEPDAARDSDFTVILGTDYNSCDVGGVLEVNR
ncbi:MAG: LytR family transcriptional regulator [Anaerolineaceae bacterium]|nr:MAG: LytR family transcriptional regulator [Anaerolineaceae bacterium]